MEKREKYNLGLRWRHGILSALIHSFSTFLRNVVIGVSALYVQHDDYELQQLFSLFISMNPNKYTIVTQFAESRSQIGSFRSRTEIINKLFCVLSEKDKVSRNFKTSRSNSQYKLFNKLKHQSVNSWWIFIQVTELISFHLCTKLPFLCQSGRFIKRHIVFLTRWQNGSWIIYNVISWIWHGC